VAEIEAEIKAEIAAEMEAERAQARPATAGPNGNADAGFGGPGADSGWPDPPPPVPDPAAEVLAWLRGEFDEVNANLQSLANRLGRQEETVLRITGSQETELNSTLAELEGCTAHLRNEAATLRETRAQLGQSLPRLVAEADASRRAADAARFRLASTRATRKPSNLGPAPATRVSAQAAVAEALRQVGKPYVYGAAGPNSFDCSGLTLWAWRAGGVSLPHYTGAQYSSTTHISFADLAPGDLVYSASMGHMGMYIGNGNVVEAPHTGLNVRVVPMRSEFTLASRP